MSRVIWSQRATYEQICPDAYQGARSWKTGRDSVYYESATGSRLAEPYRFAGVVEVVLDSPDAEPTARLRTAHWSREDGDWDEYKTLPLDIALSMGFDPATVEPARTEWQAEIEATAEKAATQVGVAEWHRTLLGRRFSGLTVGMTGWEDDYGNYVASLPRQVVSDDELSVIADGITFDDCE